MPGKVIGESLNFGYAGTPSRMSDCVIVPYAFATTHTGDKIKFGEAVAYDPDNNGVRKVTASDTAASIVGIAVRRIGQPKSDDAEGWYYAPGEVVDVLVRGAVSVVAKVTKTTSVKPHGAVYVATAASGDIAIGDINTENGIKLNDTTFTHGNVDGENVTEIVIGQRNTVVNA